MTDKAAGTPSAAFNFEIAQFFPRLLHSLPEEIKKVLRLKSLEVSMLVNLLSLYKKETKTGRTPIEDFITEVFAEILRRDQPLLQAFTKLIQLPEDEYLVLTQEKYTFDDNPCIVDLVLVGKRSNTICFFESKVNSLEGPGQLNRYSSLLARKVSQQSNCDGKGVLVYCTKYLDEKQAPPEVAESNSLKFIQIRWHEIYDLLNKYPCAPYVTDFLALLRLQRMNQRLVMTNDDLEVFKTLQSTIALLKEYLIASRSDFLRSFNIESKHLSDGLTISTILEQNKVFYRYTYIMKGDFWSDLKYGFDFENRSIFINIWIDNRHPILNLARNKGENLLLGVRSSGNGVEIYVERKLSDLIGSTQAKVTVKEWFNSSFARFSDLIAEINENLYSS